MGRFDGKSPEAQKLEQRREFIKKAAAGTLIVAFGGILYRLADDDLTRKAMAETRADGRRRLPPGQKHVLERLKPMGGSAGSPKPKDFHLRVHGAVKKELNLDFAELLKLPQVEEPADVHCVTGWSMLGGLWLGVRVSTLAEMAGLEHTARHVIFEAAHGYTTNIDIHEAMKPNVRIVHRLDGRPLARRNGAPVRGLVPDRYFWKSAKWLTGIRFQRRDEPGYWETRGYSNHADPWREERYA